MADDAHSPARGRWTARARARQRLRATDDELVRRPRARLGAATPPGGGRHRDEAEAWSGAGVSAQAQPAEPAEPLPPPSGWWQLGVYEA